MRRAVNWLFTVAVSSAAAGARGIIVVLRLALFWRGGSALSWNFLTEQVRLVGAAGGVFFNIVGTLILILTALIVSVPLATGLALLHGVFLKTDRARERVWLFL